MNHATTFMLTFAALVLAGGMSGAAPAPESPTPPTAYWPMEEIMGGKIQDRMGCHNATVPVLVGAKDSKTGGPMLDFTPATEPGRMGNALAFVREQQGFLAVDTATKFDFTNGLTVSAWVKIKEPNAQMILFSCAEDIPTPAGGWCLTYSYGEVLFLAVNATGQPVVVASAEDSVPSGVWVHVTAVIDATSLRLYLNGVEAGSKEFVGPVRMAETPLVIGNHATVAGWRHNACPAFGGLMDEVKIFERPLAAAAIASEAVSCLSK